MSRLFTERDVRTLMALARPNPPTGDVLGRDIIADAVKRELVTPFEIEVPGGHDQARAFAEWLETGKMPEWRKRQLQDAAVSQALHDALGPKR